MNSLVTFPQVNRGDFLDENVPRSIDTFFIDNHLNIDVLRNTTNFLTNKDIRFFDNKMIPKRKGALIRHVKHLSEIAECQYFDGEIINDEVIEIVYELFLLEASLKQKAIKNAHPQVTFKEKVSMGKSTRKSKSIFKYSIPSQIDTVIKEPKDSPYYHSLKLDMPMHKQFAYLAKQKKIDPKKKMVLLFKSSSLSGSAPKINTYDLDLDNQWSLKWGDEVHTDIVGSRIFASLGYDVDHPYFYGKDKLTLVFDEILNINNSSDLVASISEIYNIDISSFISNFGLVTKEMAESNKRLLPFIGKQYVRFLKCSIEARPDRVKRIGSFLPFDSLNANRKALKGSLLAHHFIGNWDTREANTLLTTVHSGNYNYRVSAVFSDLGTSLGVDIKRLIPDFKVGLINSLSWEVVTKKRNKIVFDNRVNAILPFYKNSDYYDLLWMANKIAMIDEYNLRKMINKAHWPYPIAELYFHKLASRRASILQAFNIVDPHKITFDKKICIVYNGIEVVKKGKLIVDFNSLENPESFLSKKGRLRNYGN